MADDPVILSYKPSKPEEIEIMPQNGVEPAPPPYEDAVGNDRMTPVEDIRGKKMSENEETGASKVDVRTNMANGEAVPETSTKNGDKDDKDKKEEPQKMVGVFETFRYADGKDKLLMFMGSLCACIHGAALPAMIIVFGEMTDSFVNFGGLRNYLNTLDLAGCCNLTTDIVLKDPNNLIPFVLNRTNQTHRAPDIQKMIQGPILDQMRTYALYYVIIACGVFVLAYGQVTFWLLAAYRQTRKIRRTFFRSVLRKHIGWFDTHEVGELNTRMSDDISKIQDGIGEKLGQFFQFFCAFLAGFVIGFIYGWKLTLVILSISPLLAICGGFLGKLGATMTSKELKAYAKAGAVAEEVLSAVRTVIAFGGEEKECKRYNNNLEEARSFGIKKGLFSGGGMGVFFFIMFASYALAFWYGSQLVRGGEYTPGQLLIVFFCVLIGAFSMGSAAPNITYFGTARGAAYAIYNIIDENSEIDSESNEGLVPDDITGEVEFKNVHFTYPSRPDVPILKGFNVRVNVGETVALVGSSGCGKSTTVQLLQRFYDPAEGQVTLGGYNVKDLNIKFLRNKIGMVSQEPVLFATTIGENIRYGRDGVTQDEIEHACRMSNCHDFISKLPQGYNTLVGERGAQLSGGQKQRIAIARALVRDPKILLLDEATSALDTESEAIVQGALDKARMGRTTIVIAHRLSTVRTADQIAGIKGGVVVEMGSHDALMQQDGVYKSLVLHQQAHFDDDEEMSATKFEFKRGLSMEESRQSLRRKRTTSAGSKYERGMSVSSLKEEEEEVPEVSVMRVMKMNAPEIPFIILGCFGALISGGIQPAFAIIFSEIIGVFAILDEAEQTRKSNLYSLMFLMIGVAAGLAMLIQAAAFSRSGEYLTWRLRQITFKAFLRQDVSYFDDHRHNTGALTTRLATDASAVQGVTGARLGTMCQSLCSIGVGLIIGFIFSWKLTLVILAFAPLIMVAGALQMKMHKGQASEGQAASEEAGKTGVEALENIRTVASLTKEPQFIKMYNDQIEIPYKQNMKKAHVIGVSFSMSQAIVFFAYAAAFTFGAWLIENDGLEFQNMFKVFSAIIFSAMAVGQASAFAPDYGKGKLAANRIFALFDRVPEIDSFSEDGAKPSSCQGMIEFNDVHFNYPSRPDIPVLNGLNVCVKPGEILALVGSSGCGKSTTVQLIERFYNIHSGQITMDGNETTQLNIKWLRGQMGIVSQEPILFDSSIRDNIAYGDNNREIKMDEIIQAARSANIHNFIASLPDGYDTNVGDKGTQLSGGQKQRVAIARALIRNPKVLLLDEATSALDTESEKVVQEALDKAQEGRTSIVIAHRLSTIQNADCIAVIQHGSVVESGTHQELLSRKGVYYKLNNAQLKKA